MVKILRCYFKDGYLDLVIIAVNMGIFKNNKMFIVTNNTIIL